MDSSMFKSLRNYNFKLFWYGQVISLTGSWMQMTALPWLVLQMTHRADILGLITMFQFLPIMIFSLFGGVIADRVPKRRFLIGTQTAAFILSVILGTLVLTHTVRLWELYLLTMLGGLNAAFDNPTRQAFVMEMVGREDLPNAMALNSGLFNAARLVGPTLAGLAIGPGTPLRMALAFYFNAVSFLFAIGALMLMKPGMLQPGRPSSRGNAFAQVVEGWRYCLGAPQRLILIVIMGVIGTFGYNFSVSMPLLAQHFHAGARGFGFFSACMGLGSVLGAGYLARRGTFTRRLLLFGGSAFSLLLGSVAFSGHLLVACALLVLTGFANAFVNTVGSTLLQIEAPDELRGRVMSIAFLLFAGSTPIGAPITGFLADRYKILPTIGIEAAICVGGMIWGIAYYFVRRIYVVDQEIPGSRKTVLRTPGSLAADQPAATISALEGVPGEGLPGGSE